MPKKKNSSKQPRKSGRSNASSKFSLNRILLAVALLVLVVTAAVVVTRVLIPRAKVASPVAKVVPPVTQPEKPAPKAVMEIPHYEVYPKESPPSPPPPAAPRPPEVRPGVLPKVAIIIDDMGADRKMSRKFLELDAVLTYSILPFSPLQEEVREMALKKGMEIMLHLPMEPQEYPGIDPGPGGLLTSMSPDELIDQLKKDLAAVAGVVGVNNHMGSRMTEKSEQMNQIFSVLKKEGLFFIDSRTSPASLCRPSARLFRVPFGERDVFLDHVQKPEVIREQIEHLLSLASKKGEAIGIGHPHAVTLEVLQEMLPRINGKVRLVPVSELVRLQS